MGLLRAFAIMLLLGLAPLVAALPAAAHPHVFVVVKTEVLFGADGHVEALRHAWTFDEFYSAYQVQGLAKDGKRATREDLAPLAKEQAEGLKEFGYFTVAKSAGRQVDFGEPEDYSLEEGADKLVTLRFTVRLIQPASARRAFTVQVYDPSYFVAFDLDRTDPVKMPGAPAGCTKSVSTPPPLVIEDAKKLDEAFFTRLSPGADFGIKMASRAIIACP